jgi:ABC-type proline/glycine betaine transport system permease subunit
MDKNNGGAGSQADVKFFCVFSVSVNFLWEKTLSTICLVLMLVLVLITGLFVIIKTTKEEEQELKHIFCFLLM